jgi:hypothetical protein
MFLFNHLMLFSLSLVFVEKLEVYSFSSGMYLPHFETNKENAQIKLNKIYFRILFRSQVTILRSDFNALDLYAVSKTFEQSYPYLFLIK